MCEPLKMIDEGERDGEKERRGKRETGKERRRVYYGLGVGWKGGWIRAIR